MHTPGHFRILFKPARFLILFQECFDCPQFVFCGIINLKNVFNISYQTLKYSVVVVGTLSW